jgi:beta-lactam-binding protein with PASTA domain
MEGECVSVPRITQTNVTEAYKLLHEAGLRVEIPERFSVAALQEPGPAKQTPHPGELVPPATVVTLRLWNGPLASPARRPRTVVVLNGL